MRTMRRTFKDKNINLFGDLDQETSEQESDGSEFSGASDSEAGHLALIVTDWISLKLPSINTAGLVPSGGGGL